MEDCNDGVIRIKDFLGKKLEKKLDGCRTVGFKAGLCGIGMEISVQGCVGLGLGCATNKWDVDGCVL